MDQSQPGGQITPPRPKNWLVESILVTLLCFPFGIVGIVNAGSVNMKYDLGDYSGALNSSEQAAKWTKIGFWVSVAFYAILIFLYKDEIKRFLST